MIENLDVGRAKKITGGLQATAAPDLILKKFPKIDYLIGGESEIVLSDIADTVNKSEDIEKIKGISFFKDGKFLEMKIKK